MEPREIEINGHRLSLKLMDASYIMCEEEATSRVTVDVGCRTMSPCWPNPLYVAYYRKILAAYGLGPVFLWQERRIVGFLPIGVPGCGLPEPPLCVHYAGGLAYGAERPVDLAMIERASPLPPEFLDPKEIRIGCMSIVGSMRGKNLARSMIRYIIDWGKQNGWEKICARVMMDGEAHSFYPTHSYWLEMGFKPAGPIRYFGPSGDAYDRSKALDLEFNLTTADG